MRTSKKQMHALDMALRAIDKMNRVYAIGEYSATKATVIWKGEPFEFDTNTEAYFFAFEMAEPIWWKEMEDEK